MVRATALGRVTPPDVEEHLKLERHFHGLLYPEIIDARAADLDLSYEDVRRIVGLVRRMSAENKFGPTAVIVSNDVAFGVVKMLEALLDDVAAIAPFRSEVEAKEWLDGTRRRQ
jgi:hypothetical protein